MTTAEPNNCAALWQAIGNALPDAVLFFDEGTLVLANPAACERFGIDWTAQELSPKAVFRDRTVAQLVRECQVLGKRVSVHVDRDGRVFKCEAVPVSADEADEREQEDVRPRNRKVAVVVSDITTVHSSSFARRDFITNVSHELKTPVTGIQALAESLSLAFDRDPERAKTMCTRIEAEAVRLSKLVRELLDLARYEEEVHGDLQRVNLAEVCANQVLRVRELALSSHITVELDVPEDLFLVTFLPALKLIISNLLSNAVMYNKDGGSVVLSVHKTEGDVVIEVSDTGVGIPEAAVSRIFERFYRVDKARSRSAGGTGLGLSLVEQAVTQLKGHIRVHSVLDEGTQMVVVLPVDGVVE